MKAIFLILLVTISLTSCSKSVLSDVEITDPHLLKVKVKLEQDSNNEKEIQVYIRDKNNKPVELMTGRVVINDHTALFNRAEVNSTGARGYMYCPYEGEQVFKISVYWNSNESHTFILSPSNGWPGFGNSDNYSCSNGHKPTFESDTYLLRPAPFYNQEINVAYKIIDYR